MFAGDACEQLSCYADGYGRPCSNNGACMTLRKMAGYAYNSQKVLAGFDYTTPWDADLIRGCVCNRAISVDNQYYSDYTMLINAHAFNSSTLNDTATYTDVDLTKFYRGYFLSIDEMIYE